MKSLQTALQICIDKGELYWKSLHPPIREYRSTPDGHYMQGNADDYIPLQHIFAWTPSFFLGIGVLSYRLTNDNKWLRWLYSFKAQYQQKVTDTPMETMHDLGFLYSPYAVAIHEITHDDQMKEMAIKAADELAKRFVPSGSYIRAWGRMDNKIPDYVTSPLAEDHFFTENKGLAIIDSMMNLPLLFWASKQTGHPYYERIAEAHADTTLRYFIRGDYSVCHAYRFDEQTGEAIGEDNYCGYNASSHWARGTAWAIYGFAIAYSYTGHTRYLEAAMQLSLTFIALSGAKGIPIWDFKLPDNTPALPCGNKSWTTWDAADPANTTLNVDTSAAAIAASAFHEILKYDDNATIKEARLRILETLANEYTNADLQTPGILQQQNGQGVYTIFGDYFYMEALAKYLHDMNAIW